MKKFHLLEDVTFLLYSKPNISLDLNIMGFEKVWLSEKSHRTNAKYLCPINNHMADYFAKNRNKHQIKDEVR